MKLKKYAHTHLSILDVRKTKKIVWVLITISMYAYVFFIPNISKVLSHGILAVRNQEGTFYESSIFSKVAILGAFSSPYCVFFFYYILSTEGLTRTAKLLLISSFSFILYTLNVGGRDGIIIWLFSFVGGYCLFNSYLSSSVRKYIHRVGTFFLLITIPVLMFITIARFSVGDTGVVQSLFSYTGQPLPNLSYEIDLTDKIGKRSGEDRVPIALLQEKKVNRMDRIRELMEYGFKANQFKSYIGNFYPSYPIYVLFVFLIIIVIVFRYNFKVEKGIVRTSNLFIAYSWFMVPTVGMFYFYYNDLSGNVYLLIPFFVKLYYKISFK